MNTPAICLTKHDLGNARKAFDAKVAEVKRIDESNAKDSHVTAARIMLDAALSERKAIVESINAQAKSGNFNVDWGVFSNSIGEIDGRTPFTKIDDLENSNNNESLTANEGNYEQSESTAIGTSGNPALGGTPTANDATTQKRGSIRGGSVGGGAKDTGRSSGTRKSGDSSRKRVGNGTGDLFVSDGGGGSDTGSGAIATIPNRTGNSGDAQRDLARVVGAVDYRISSLTKLGEGGQRAKYNDNVAAIRLMRSLQEEGRTATPEEQHVLARYVGWGGIPQAFDPNNKDWSKQYDELNTLLSPDEREAAIESTQYAHYTSEGVINGIYSALKHLGFSGGKILEPGSGVGNFIGLMPDAMRNQSRFTGVEREKIAGGIAKLLYPNQNIQQQDFTYFNANDEYFDAVIGNPPFAATGLVDMTGRKHLSGLSVHNYFFAKSIDMLRENGVLAMVVTSSFMDAKKDRARSYIAERASLIGAIRLPNSAFMGNAGTDVTTDIIFLKKRPESEWGSKAAKEDAKRWLEVATVPDPLGGAEIPLNQYFVTNPNMMIGRMERIGGRYREDMPGLVAPKGIDVKAEMEQRIKNLPENVYVSSAQAKTKSMTDAAVTAMSNIDAAVGGYFTRDGVLYQRLPDIAGEQMASTITPDTKWTEKTALGEKKFKKLFAASEIRRTLRQLIVAESKNSSEMTPLREQLSVQYDAFVKDHGYFNDRASIQLLADDPDYPLLMSLENAYDPGITDTAAKKQGIKAVKPSAKKTAIFTKSILGFREAVTKADSPVDALMISIAERGRIDPQFIGELLGRDGSAVLSELSQGLNPELFIDPAGNGYVLKDEYLSGNVRKKLAQAKNAGLDVNARALEAVLPADIPSHEIQGKLGAPWIPTETYEGFISHLLGDSARASVAYVKALNVFNVNVSGASEVANTNTYGTQRKSAVEILTSLLNNKEIKVGYTDEDGKWHLLKTETDEALDKAAIIREKFGDWLMSDPDRSEALTREYNDKMNNYVVRKFDGSILSFPGKVSDLIIKFRRHQRNAISRIIQEGRGLLDHVVGAGKTFTVIGAAMELKRTGLAKKSMIVVPNHLVKQWATDFYRLYPGANILTATKKDFEKANRRKFLAKIATGDWDAVIIAHSSFGFIKPDPVFEEKFNNERIKEVMDAIKEMGDPKSADSASKRTIKQLAKMKENLEQKIKSLRDKPMDDLLDLGQLGVDQIFVDEAHLFKNLMFTTKMQNVRGLGQPEGSQRAYDMFIKTRQITEANGGTRGVVFATGTPVSNSLAEMYHMMRYLMPESLMDMGHATFDAWANTFADVEQVWMQAMSGDGYKSTNRMTKFVNTPDLLKAFNQVADTVTIEDIKDAYREENEGKEFPIPALKGGRRTPVSLIRTKEQSDYMEEIAARAKELENNKGKPEKGKDNMLSILGDARKAAMDIRLVNPAVATRDPNSRIATVARNVFDTYQKFNDVLGTQLIFSDMGTPKKTAAKELDEYNELMAKIAPLSDPDTLASADLGDENAIELLEKAEEAQAKMDSYGKDWLDGIKSALNGFSIYDDTKAALVEMGIPENEIAFIHDYNTDEQKAALFRAVNDGKIRVLMGSTPKMGAGTNVQDRLVELHHMDVPWKPSDIEQREGRIVRQGNKLLEMIGKDFEVSIKAYATQDTLDLFMWQVQEKKLAMINQLRTGQVGREMDDAFEELQMSAGEMQAAATSNPYLLEEIQLKDKVKKLERKKKSFEGQRNDLINRNRNAQAMVNRIPNELAIAKKILPFDQAYADLLKNRPFKMTINSDVFTDEAAAAERLRELTTIEETEEEKAANAAFDAAGVERQSRKKIDPVDINGRSYKSKTAVAEAFRFIVGDADKITFTRDGETAIRRADIEKIIREDVKNAAETDDTVYVGNLGDFEFSVTGDHDKNGKVRLIVTGKVDGVDLPFDMETQAFEDSVEAANFGAREVIALMSRQVGRMENTIYFLEHDLSKAQRTLEELKKANVDDKWDGESELAKAREDHRAVLKKINEAGTEIAKKNKFLNPLQKADGSFVRQSPVLYAQTDVAVSPENQLSEEAIYALADSALSGLENAPPVVVLDSAKLLESRAVGVESIPMSSGAMHDGTIYLFRDGIRDSRFALATIWHELFHYGLRKLMTPEMYISNLNKLYNSDANIKRLAEYWKTTEDASIRQKNGVSVTDMHLISIEEALAMTAENIKLGGDDYVSEESNRNVVRKLLSWMADIAKAIRLNRISQALRTMSLSDGEKFVKSIFKKMEDGATMSQQSMADLDTRSINYSSGNSQNQKSLSQYRNESEFIDRWENDLGQPIFYGKKYDLSPIKTFNTESDFEADSLQLGQSHTVKPSNKVHGFAIKSKDGKNLGTAILQVDNYGDIVGIHDIEIKVKNQGVGTEVVRNIVASTKSDVAVIQIVPSAQKFWKEVGVYEQDQYDNGAFNFEAFAKSIRGSAGRASQELAKDSQGRPEDGSGNEAQERGIEATGDNLTYKAPVVSPYFKDKYFFGMELDELKAYASELTKGWNNPPKITVVDVASELPFEAASHAQGIYYKGQVYLVAMNIRSEEQAQFVLMHEVLGHSGLRGAFGNQLNGKLIALASRNKDIASAAKQWRDENQWQKKGRTESEFIALSIEEVLADMAGSDIQISGFDAFVAAIQNLLRSMNLNALANWLEDRTNAEVLSMLATAKKHVTEGANDSTVAATFAHAYSSGAGAAENDANLYSTGNPNSLTASLINAVNNVKDVKLPANYLVSDLLDRSGQIGWWDKTVGTPYNLAKRNPLFANVYNRIQSFIGDVSMFTAEAADLAPTILPKLEKLADLKKMPLTAEDTKAISAAIFEGTLSWARDENGRAVKVKELDEVNEQRVAKENAQIAKRNAAKADRFKDFSIDEKKFALISGNHVQESVMKMWLGLPVEQYEKIINNKFDKDVVALEEELVFEEAKAGVVWSDSELRDIFNLNDKQIALYKEFRQAINKSLTNLAITDMVKAIGKEYRHLMSPALEKGSVTGASEFLREYFLDLAATDEENQAAHFDTVGMVMKKADKANDLMDRGYAPLSRFGKHTVYVEEAGEQVYFGLYESKMEAAKAARNMRADYPNATITSGTMSEEAYKLFAGVSIETVELFGDMLGLSDPDTSEATREAYQAYLKMAKNNRSSMKRLINRKGIAGFSEDAGRVLANFVYSNGRMTSANVHMGELDEAINAIPKTQGELKDAAVQLSEHVKNPENAGTKLGGLMFAQYLGGSVASAMVNLTQPLMMTMPYLSQYGGLKAASAQLTAAARDAYKETTGDKALDAALKLAEEEGIVSPQEVHHIQAQAAGNSSLQAGDGTLFGDAKAKVNNGMQKVMLGWGKLFSLAEQTNRRITFIAAYRTAIEQGIANPAKFAEEAIAATQGVYNSGNKPKWARNTFGSLAMTFKQYSIAYVELLNRMWNAGEAGSPERAAGRRGALYMLAVLFLMSGADGLPFEQDIEDLIDGILQRMGYNFSMKRKKEAFFTEILGDTGGSFALKGISGISGVPIDVAGRLGMGNLIPATGLLKNKESYTRDVAELAGAPGDFVVRSFNAINQAASGNLKGSLEEFAPRAVTNVIKGAEMISSGQATDKRGYKINDVSVAEGMMKVIGFQPNSTAHIQDDKQQALDLMTQAKLKSTAMQEHWAQGLAKGDMDMVREARDMRDEWNRKNPESPIRANMPAIIKRVRNMKMDSAKRTENTAPKAMKAAVREELAN